MDSQQIENEEIPEFSLKVAEKKIKFDEQVYTLKELDGKNRDEYMQSMTDRMKITPEGKVVGFKDVRGMHASLLTRCLFDPNGKPVSKPFIDAMPAGLTQKLFDMANVLSGIEAEAKEKAKNDSEVSD